MGKMRQIALAIIFTSFVVGLLATGMYNGSDDPDKTPIVVYAQYDNQTGEIIDGYQNTNKTLNTFEAIGNNLQTSIANAQTDLSSGGLEGTISGAFGLTSALVMNAFFALLGIITEGLNLVGGIGSNLMYLPTPWNALAALMGLGTVVLLIYLMLVLISAYKGWDI